MPFLWTFANGRVALMEFKIKPDSNLCNMSLSQFRKKYGNVIVCAIERGNELTIPNGDLSANLKTRFSTETDRVVLFHNNVRPQVIKEHDDHWCWKITTTNILQVRRKIDLKS